MTNTLDLACALIERQSVTPHDAGCLEIILEELTKANFQSRLLPFGQVSNLWATHGEGQPTLCLVGHTDVVPVGDESKWHTPPFSPKQIDNTLFGRGACDMKGALAAMIVAGTRFVKQYPQHQGRLAYLITSDEEGIAQEGTKAVAQWLQKQNETIDYALVGEPSSEKSLGDMIKIGRRGSLTGHLTLIGKQGHVAYPDKADNPIHAFGPVLFDLLNQTWGEPHPDFPETSLQFSNIQAGTGADNVIPGSLAAVLNFRFAPSTTAEALQSQFEHILKSHHVEYKMQWRVSGLPFITDRNSKLITAVCDALKAHEFKMPELSTKGGTSDGRFLAPLGVEVVEIGPVNKTIHQVNESVSIPDLIRLTDIYFEIIKNILILE